MKLICQVCPSTDVTLGDDGRATCEECGHSWQNSLERATASRAPREGWVADLNDAIASAIATLLEAMSVVTGRDIDLHLLAHERPLLQAVVDAGAHPTLERAAANGRGWFNRAWTEGSNHHSSRFHREQTPTGDYQFRKLEG